MNREMLLESNNIHFEPTFKNISQMVAKLFNSSDEPFVDDFAPNDAEIKNMNISIARLPHDADGSWRDVKKIFETFNKQTVTPQTSSKNQQQNTHKDEHLLSKDQNNKLHQHKNLDNYNAIKNIDCEETNSNKENIHDSVDQSSASTHQLLNSKCSIQGSRNNIETIKSIDDSKQTAYDQTNRVRQVNVEMFTVTLKHTNQK